ncbi:acyltransferase family protein [Arthrobacter sp. NIO-1057]|uniref:acyltransferase family protein n=1 Tax=Arthrobacter sp. NIO-1057 TaxID=993071 RepID=UPI00071C7E6C|nr:acyltransferase [Arthrobacter sp. NIO-1057]KSU67248.1 acyltransferase [Arthrobacter sp. NIO-1057]SCC01746.1 Peptidoglycan/LPS O-acetylase OafA/YrhL, contains acyltransferase and SGNH-hydrolase domains [Arthrobacter sp. NIO-1057]
MSNSLAPRPPASAPRLGLLDALRITAALFVVFYHYTAWGHEHWGSKAPEFWPVLSEFTRYGQLGVQLFFLISGFVILMSLQGKNIVGFIGSRVGRLYPAYWVAVIAAAVLSLVIWPEGNGGRAASDILPNLTMFQGAFGVQNLDGVYWTLWVELRFYLLLGLLLALKLTKVKHIMVLCTLWPALGLYLHFTNLNQLQDKVAGEYAALFAAGMVLYLIYQNGHTLMRWILVAGNTAVAAFFTGIKGQQDASELSGLDVPAWHFQVLAVLCVALLAVCTLTPLKHIQAKWLAVAGSLTFPLYLFHQLWGWWIIEELHGVVNKYVLLFGLIGAMLGFAYLVARFVEKPLGLPLRNATIKTLTVSTAWVKKVMTRPVPAISKPKYQQSWHQTR